MAVALGTQALTKPGHKRLDGGTAFVATAEHLEYAVLRECSGKGGGVPAIEEEDPVGHELLYGGDVLSRQRSRVGCHTSL